ncbi:T9SS type A sorting domain-containing protein [Hymenobacter aquaticus]|uniref:T9SS type A sorting domain-containing protein n=1 Tax=Hymenobacter aquaticus TaxID=1867101 RepID=A0A4Z0Q8A0_9BACT|nr:alpha/beta hydrolase-fold protein [Hymenobacter aquaticus]TGE24922.1 T9SS type A sorting domain-containing protein [Hymenobacter aquaticus]
MKQLFAFLLLFVVGTARAQVTFKLTGVPANTPAAATLYMAGSFNGWNPGSPAHALLRNADGSYQITLPAQSGTIEYKFTRGSWASVETNAANGAVPNRSYTFPAGPAVVTHTVLNWEDLAGGGGCQSSALSSNVRVMTTSFAMPQLGRTRRVWLYLPNDYATNPAKRYPVLYMHDGQNVFDNCTSFSGEWGVDETLSQLQQAGQDVSGSIVVAVDNDGTQRLNEYSPWNNPAYGGGQGDQYADFLVQTLKPYIDANYRTLTGREYTGIAGSSMGALISVYAALKYPGVYSKVGVFSPAFWFAEQSLFQYVQQHPAHPDTRFYLVSGTQESQTMVPLMQQMRDALQGGGVPAANLRYTTRADGQHAEWFWKREFGAAYQWLMAPGSVTAARGPQVALAFSAYPMPAKDALTIQLPATVKEARLEILDTTGRVVLKSKVKAGQPVNLSQLAKGHYLLRLSAGPQTGSQALIKE